MKKLSKILIITAGLLNLLSGIFHFAFWQLFNWGETLLPLDPLNRNILIMLNYCLASFFLLSGILILFFRHEISFSRLGRSILFSVGTIILVRLILEFILPHSNIVTGGILLFIIICHYAPALLKQGVETAGNELVQ